MIYVNGRKISQIVIFLRVAVCGTLCTFGDWGLTLREVKGIRVSIALRIQYCRRSSWLILFQSFF